jgi:hypothetical protein
MQAIFFLKEISQPGIHGPPQMQEIGSPRETSQLNSQGTPLIAYLGLLL